MGETIQACVLSLHSWWKCFSRI